MPIAFPPFGGRRGLAAALVALAHCALARPSAAQEQRLTVAFPASRPMAERRFDSLGGDAREATPVERPRPLAAPETAAPAERASAPDIVRYVYAHRGHFRACVEPPVRGHPLRDERVDIELAIQPAGTVSRARVVASPGAAIEPICVAAILSQLRFPPPGVALSLRFPFDWTPQRPARRRAGTRARPAARALAR